MEIVKNIFFMLSGLALFILGLYGAYLKLFDKNSWLYKESEGVHWLYDLDGQRTWALILCVIMGGIIIFLGSLEEIKNMF